VCSSLAALRPAAAPIWLFCAGRPGRAAYRPVRLPEPALR